MRTTLTELVEGWFNTACERLNSEELDREVEDFRRSEIVDNGLDAPRWTHDEVLDAMVAQNECQFPQS